MKVLFLCTGLPIYAPKDTFKSWSLLARICYMAFCLLIELAMAFHACRMTLRMWSPFNSDQAIEFALTYLYIIHCYVKMVITYLTASRLRAHEAELSTYSLPPREGLWLRHLTPVVLGVSGVMSLALVGLCLLNKGVKGRDRAFPNLTYWFFDYHPLVPYIYHLADSLAIYTMISRLLMWEGFQLGYLARYEALLTDTLDQLNHGLDLQDPTWCGRWVDTHVDAMKKIKDSKKIFEPFYLASYICSLVNISLSVAFVLVDGDMPWVQKVYGSSFQTLFLFLFGLICYRIDHLEERHQSLVLRFDGYKTWTSPRWMRSFFVVTTTFCRQPIKMSAMGFFKLSLSDFAQIIGASVSLLATLMRTVGRPKEDKS